MAKIYIPFKMNKHGKIITLGGGVGPTRTFKVEYHYSSSEKETLLILKDKGVILAACSPTKGWLEPLRAIKHLGIYDFFPMGEIEYFFRWRKDRKILFP